METLEQVIERLVRKIAFLEPYEEYSSDMSFDEDFGLDSLDCVEFIMEIEKIYNITIDDTTNDVIACNTVGKCCDFLKAKYNIV